MIKYDWDLQPLTKELLDSLTPWQRHNCIKNYREWLKEVRKQDRKVLDKIGRMLPAYRIKKREYEKRYRQRPEIKVKIKAKKKEYYQQHAEELKAKSRERYRMRKGVVEI